MHLAPPEPCVDGLTSTNAYQQCVENTQALIVFEWETECQVESVSYSNVEGAGPFVYEVAEDATNFGVYAGNGQMPPNWSVEHQLVVNSCGTTISLTKPPDKLKLLGGVVQSPIVSIELYHSQAV